MKAGLWYDNLTCNYKGYWLTFSGMDLNPVLKQVHDDFGNLVSV